MKVKDKVIAVTGGGSGIGRELVLALLEKGARVAAIDIREEGLAKTAQLAGSLRDRLLLREADVADRASVEALPEHVLSHFGAVDGVINNAGIIHPFVRVTELDYAMIERVMNVNLFGTLYMIKAFLPHLLARPEGHITNISSMGGFLPVPGQTIYGASKAAVKLLTEGLCSELTGTNVRVTVVFPGAVDTNIAANAGLDQSAQVKQGQKSIPMLPARKAAEIIIEGIEQNRYRVLVGPDARFLDVAYRVSPKRAAQFISKQMSDLLPQ